MNPTTALYVPGDRPDRFDKAVAADPDVVILDLEDAVAPARREYALSCVLAWLAAPDAGPRPAVQVRVNRGAEHEIVALRAIGVPIGLRLPKVECAADVEEVAAIAGGLALTALIESARGVECAAQIAAHPEVAALGLGESDLAADLGTRHSAVLDHVRVRLLLAARAHGLPAPMLSAFTAIDDPEALRTDTERGRELGWHGRAAIHPAQLPTIRAVFAARDSDEAWAREVLSSVGTGGVARLADGQMVDAAMVRRARAILRV